MKKSKSQKSEKFTVVLDDSAWSRYLLKSDPKALRDDFESNDNSAVSAINFLAACEAEARRVLERIRFHLVHRDTSGPILAISNISVIMETLNDCLALKGMPSKFYEQLFQISGV